MGQGRGRVGLVRRGTPMGGRGGRPALRDRRDRGFDRPQSGSFRGRRGGSAGQQPSSRKNSFQTPGNEPRRSTRPRAGAGGRTLDLRPQANKRVTGPRAPQVRMARRLKVRNIDEKQVSNEDIKVR